ncbi:PepSY domain-containing protein [Shewanella gaetbuli]|uniref:PepSY domain-containing protein n=1 Tax=Shewanella gaetbuli TaxID=220752 RepID=A0A9X1ZPK7_9GAMM|nr:PepSY domain-containing protein [Shewanella gaetbuli]MCL1141748.1 PepSY domain-containing protein [Shewanella gaetbuli]
MNFMQLKCWVILPLVIICWLGVSLPSYGQRFTIDYGHSQVSHPGPGAKSTKKLAIKSPQQASSRAQRQFGGKVLRVQSSQVNGNPGYRVKLLSDDGVVFYATVNAVSGSVSRN